MKQVVSQLSKHVEIKYFDQFSSASLTAAGTLANISDVTRGAEVTQRVGNQITFKGIEVRFSATINGAATSTAVRMLLFLDTMGVNAPNVGDVLDSTFLGSTYSQVAPYYWDYRKRFVMLKDETTYVNKESNASCFYHVKHKLNVISQNIGSATTFKNQIYLLLVSNEPNVLALPTFWYTTRLTYTDE